MVVAFYEPFAYDINFERCLEIIESHIKKGDTILFIGCNGSLVACDTNLYHFSAICNACISRRKQGLKLLSEEISYVDFHYLKSEQNIFVKEFLESLNLKDVETIKKITFDEFDIGTAVMSSLISHLRQPHLDTNHHKKLILNFFKASLEAYLSVINHIEDKKIELFYAYNGRLAPMRAGIRAAKKMKVDFYTHEITSSLDKYSLFFNALPHSISKNQEMMKAFWKESPEAVRISKGTDFYQAQAEGTLLGGQYSFTKNHTQGLLPENWDDAKHNIVIFNSSEDEFAAIGKEWQGGVYSSQFEGIKKISETLSKFPGYHFYLRLHPNLMTADNSIVREFDQLNSDGFTIIPADSPISTYSLVNLADKVIAFSSTVGIEAAFRQKPSLILGRSLYQNLGSTYHPETHEETMDLLLNKDLAHKDITGALIYGYYRSSYGIPFENYVADTVFKGRFKGEYIDLPFWQKKMVLFFKKLQKLKKIS
jgi:hypothetical protein